MGLRKLFIFGDLFRIGTTFSLQNTFWHNFQSKASRSMLKADDNLCDVIFSHDSMVSQKFWRTQSKDRHIIRTIDDIIVGPKNDSHDTSTIAETISWYFYYQGFNIMICHYTTRLLKVFLIHYQTTNFRLFQTKRVCRRQFKFDENVRKLPKRVKNTVRKGEIARNEQFLLFQQCFQKACFPWASKGVIVWEWVKQPLKQPTIL